MDGRVGRFYQDRVQKLHGKYFPGYHYNTCVPYLSNISCNNTSAIILIHASFFILKLRYIRNLGEMANQSYL